MQERLFTTDQVADLLGTTSREVRQWIAKGWLASHTGPDGVDRVSEKGLIKFLKGRGIDIMQLMVSTAVRHGSRAASTGGKDKPPASNGAPATQGAELLGEASAGLPGPEVLSASDGPAGPSIDEDVASALAAREMLTGQDPGKDAHEPAPVPSLDLPNPRGPRPAGPASQNGAGRPGEILDQEELAALLGSPPDSAESGTVADPERSRRAETPEGAREADSQQGIAGDDGPFLAGVDEVELPIEEQEEQLAGVDEVELPIEEQEEQLPAEARAPGEPDFDEQDDEELDASKQALEERDADEEPADEPSGEAHAAAVAAQVASAVLDDAVRRDATHIHLHSDPSGMVLRLRIDGRLRAKPNFHRLPGRVESALVGRLLDLAGLGGADPARPQSGRFTHEVDGRAVRMTLSSFPTTHGARLAIALPPRRQTSTDLAELGATPADAEHIRRLLTTRRGGLLLVCGPSGDGRGDVLRALGGQLAGMGRDVLVINADRTEGAEVPDASNSNVDPVAGYRFSDAARHLAEQDADAIVLAELRGPATAAAALEAAISGVMVVAGIRAATAAEALGTLAEMEVESWPLAAMLRGVIVCRTLRRLCRACRKPVPVPRRLPNGVRIPRGALGDRTFEPVGCPRCSKSGYDGRVRLLSLLRPDRQIVRLVRIGAASDTVAATVRGASAGALMELAAEHIRAGDASLDELAGLAPACR